MAFSVQNSTRRNVIIWRHVPTSLDYRDMLRRRWLLRCRPQTKFAKVMFLHMSVILSTGGRVCPSACWDAHPPGPEAGTPPQDQRQTPPQTRGRLPPDQRQNPSPTGAVHAGRYGQQVGGTHPTGMHSCSVWFLSLHLSQFNSFLSSFQKCAGSLNNLDNRSSDKWRFNIELPIHNSLFFVFFSNCLGYFSLVQIY